MSLNARTWLGFGGLALVMGLVLFLSAGTVSYWQGWVYLAAFFTPSLLITLYLMRHDPALLERRLRGGPTAEKESRQKLIMLVASLCFIALQVVPALDHRFGWSGVPLPAVVLGDVLIAVGFYTVYLVFHANPYTAATIEIATDQRVVTTGPYAIVRHPMYAGSFIYLLGTPLALGSWWGFAPLACMLPVLVWRMLDEERLLSRELPGYDAYRAKVRWRLIPGVY